MSVITSYDGLAPLLGAVPQFSFFEQSVIEIPAPQKYEWAQAERKWILRDKSPEWFLRNELWAHKFYMMKRFWWQTIA